MRVVYRIKYQFSVVRETYIKLSFNRLDKCEIGQKINVFVIQVHSIHCNLPFVFTYSIKTFIIK